MIELVGVIASLIGSALIAGLVVKLLFGIAIATYESGRNGTVITTARLLFLCWSDLSMIRNLVLASKVGTVSAVVTGILIMTFSQTSFYGALTYSVLSYLAVRYSTKLISVLAPASDPSAKSTPSDS